MASDNLMTMEQPWQFRPTFPDTWISDFLFAKETDTLTKALTKSFAATSSDGGDAFSPDSFFPTPDTAPLQTPTPSGGSENETAKPRRSLPPTGRVTKRKSRASKRATTTYINADPANFRQMVQQVTGVRFGGFSGQVPAPPQLLKPEPHRAMNSCLQPTGGLPTLDSSAYGLLDGSASAAADGAAAEFDSFCSFPTLESSKVVELWNNL